MRGFCCRCQKKRKVYQIKLRIKGRQRWLTIGEHGSPHTVDTARVEARRLIVKVREGVDIAALRDAKQSQPTMVELCERFLEEHARPNKKASSVRSDEKNIANHVTPLLGHFNVCDITRTDIEQFKLAVRNGETVPKSSNPNHQGGGVVRGGPGVANRSLALLSKMFNLAEVWGWRDEYSNPCRLVTKYPEKRRQRFLADHEITRLMTVLDTCDREQSESPYATASVRLLLLTGARLGEILSLRWEWVDLQRRMLLLPDSKTGERVVFLNEAAVDILQSLERQPKNPFVIVGNRLGSHMVNLQKPWARIRSAANLNDVRLHDLRHSFASIAASNGASLPLIGQLLGHTQPATTQRYAHLAAKPVQDVSDAVGRSITDRMKRTRGGEDG
ncbi:MAG: tyrosine-type recombinase/integrase [Pseudomonadota bacterium]